MDSEDKYWLSLWAMVVAAVLTLVGILVYADFRQNEQFLKAGMVMCPLPGTAQSRWMPASKCLDYPIKEEKR